MRVIEETYAYRCLTAVTIRGGESKEVGISESPSTSNETAFDKTI